MNPAELNRVTEVVIGAAIAVHRELGPGLLESTYQGCLVHELERRGVDFEPQKAVPVSYRGRKIDCAYRLDLVVSRAVIVELKSIERFEPVHTAQMLTYLKLTGCPLGLLINFNVPLLKHGIRRLALTPPTPAAQPNSDGLTTSAR